VRAREFQKRAIVDLRQAIASGKRAPLFVLPTGGGKTFIAVEIISSALAKGRRVLFVAPRRQLVYQTVEALAQHGITADIVMAGEQRVAQTRVSVASIDTLHRRMEVAPSADIVIVDEAHCVMGDKARAVLGEYTGAIRIGLTATPARADGRGLGEFYDEMILGPTMAELIADGFLVPMRYFSSPNSLDLSGIKVAGGDYQQGQLGERMSETTLVGDVVRNWQRLGQGRQTIVFAVHRGHAKALQYEFNQVGVVADYIDGNTETEDRKIILRRIENGDSQVLCSVDVLSYGWNSPAVSCAVLARPTKSIARYLQMIGRVLRPYPGKTDAIMLDHGNVVDELGFVDEDQPWTLEGKKIQEIKKEREKKEPGPITCPHCHAKVPPARLCRECGSALGEQFARAVAAVKAELEEKRKSAGKRWTKDEKQVFYSELIGMASDRGYSKGWVSHTYRDKLGVWPQSLVWAPAAATDETQRFVQHKMIKYRKGQEGA